VGFLGFIVGSILGSFVLVLAERSLTNKSFWGRSYCPHCKHKLRWYDLLPILSYLSLRGRCRFCQKAISLSYLVVEVVMGLLVGFLFWQSAGSLHFELLSKTFFITILIALFITDYQKMLIPDRIIIPSIWIGLALNLVISLIKYAAQPFFPGLVMATLIGGFFLMLIIITKGKGMGGGDVKLGVFIGLMLGFPLSLLAIVASFIIGAVFSLGLIIAGKKHFGQTIPFGPFLVLGSLIALFWGNQIIDWYLTLGT